MAEKYCPHCQADLGMWGHEHQNKLICTRCTKVVKGPQEPERANLVDREPQGHRISTSSFDQRRPMGARPNIPENASGCALPVGLLITFLGVFSFVTINIR